VKVSKLSSTSYIFLGFAKSDKNVLPVALIRPIPLVILTPVLKILTGVNVDGSNTHISVPFIPNT
jgi:hypothetical protein